MKHILLLSRVNTTNLGDQLIGRSMISLFSKYGEITQTDIVSALKQMEMKHKKASKTNHSNKVVGNGLHSRISPYLHKLLWIYRNRSNFRVLNKQYDLIVIGGGELCSGSFAFELSIWALLIRLFQKKAKVIMFGVGATHVEEKARKQLNRIIQLCDRVYVRDKASVVKFKELYNRDVVEIPDAAFATDLKNVSTENKKRYALYGMTTPARLAKHGYMFSQEREYWIHSLEQIKAIATKGCVQLFYTTKDDYESCIRFKVFCENEFGVNLDIADINNLDDLINIVNDTKNVYSPRMHACIIGILNNCEVYPIVISEKMSQFETKYKHIKSSDLFMYRQQLSQIAYDIIGVL